MGSTFARGIGEAFLADLERGLLTPVLEESRGRGLDIQIRSNYLDIYAGGRCVLSVKQSLRRPVSYQARVHGKFLAGVSMPDGADPQSGSYRRFACDPRFVENYIFSLDRILENALKAAGIEAAIEERVIQANCQTASPVICIDRQVQVPGVRGRMDLLGLQMKPEAKVFIIEIKQGLDNRIQRLMDQVVGYADLLAPTGTLREDIHLSYQQVLEQKKRLGLLPRGVSLPEAPPPVEMLVVLSGYNPRSRLLGRFRDTARSRAGSMKIPLYQVSLPEEVYVLPPRADWGVMA